MMRIVLYEEENGDFGGIVELDEIMVSNDNQDMSHSIRWYNNSEDYSASFDLIYNLQGKYDTVSGTMFLSNNDKSTTFKGLMKAYADGKLIYTSPEFTAGVLPKDIEFKVTGVQRLTISFQGQGEGGLYSLSGLPKFGINNLTAQKAFPE